MATTIVLAGTSYSIPSEGDGGYAQDVSAYLIALANNTKVFQASSANFPLQQETNFGSNYGLKVAYVKSQAANPAGTGIFRLGNNEALGWRNAANSADLALKVNASDVLEFNGSSISIGGAPVQTAITVSDTSTLDLTLSSNDISGSVKAGSLDDSHISVLAAIAYSKLALTGSIVNADISASAAIALSKLATVTASKALVSDASGYVSASSVTNTELGYLSGVTSSVQTQLTANATGISDHLADTVDAHDASAISSIPSGNLAATDVQGALNELQTDIDTRATSSALAAHTSATSAHGVSGAVVGTSDTQVLTNKDIDGGTASNTSRITIPKATKTTLDALTRKEATLLYASDQSKLFVDDGVNLKEVGSGAGGNVNFITNGDGSLGLSDWTEGSYVASERPSGTFTPSSGAGAFAISTTTTNPLGIGTTSFLLTKSSGASRQGRAIETSFALPLDYRAKVLEVNVSYIINSGTFVAGSSTTDSSLIWYTAFSTDNGATYTVAEPSSFKLLSNNTAVSDRLVGNIQTPANATHMRLIAYVAETANSAWEVKCVVGVSPCEYVFGTPITDWVSDTVTGNWATNTTYSAKSRRVGDSKEFQVKISTSGAPTAINLQLTLPNTVDTSKLGDSTPYGQIIGNVEVFDSGTTIYTGYAFLGSSNIVGLYVTRADTAYGQLANINQLTPVSFNSGDTITATFSVPIQGWSSSVQVSDGYDGREISASYGASTSTVTNSGTTKIIFTTAITKDTVAAYSTSTGDYTVPSSGRYRVTAQYAVGGTPGATNQTATIYVAVDGTTKQLGRVIVGTTSSGTFCPQVSTIVDVIAGQKIAIYGDQQFYSGPIAVVNSTNQTFFTIEKLASPQTMSATERIACRYTSTSGTTVTNSSTTITYGNRIYDTHGAWNGTTFTAPVSGNYRITASYTPSPAGTYSGNYIQISTGSTVKINYKSATTTNTNEITDTLQLNAGQTFSIVGRTDSGSFNLDTTAVFNVLSIELVK